jgi:hypothetical protein
MNIISHAINKSFNRFDKIRLGKVTDNIDDDGLYTVTWLDGDLGGQQKVAISYPLINNADSKTWGIECGIGKGTIGVFGFLATNLTVLLTTLTSRRLETDAGYKKTEKIKTGEFRITSKGGAKISMLSDGNVTILSGENTITVSPDGININVKSGQSITLGCGSGTLPVVYAHTTTPGSKIQSLDDLGVSNTIKVGP